jgi:hypothetical protein
MIPENQRRKLMLLAAIFGISGMIILVWADWRIALGIFIATWANNIMMEYKAP